MSIIERMELFELSEPEICVWCRHCGVVVNDGLWGYVCLRAGSHRDLTKRMRGVLLPFPPNCERRTGVQCVNADERHDCFEPTRLSSRRIRLMEMLGLMPKED